MSGVISLLQVRGHDHDGMSTPQNGVVAYSRSHVARSLFARVVSRCLPWGFRLPECPSAMGIHIILDGARIRLQKGRPPSGC